MTPLTLKSIQTKVQHDQRLRLLPFECIKKVKELRVNRKRQRRKRNTRISFTQTGCNNNNVISIKKQGHKPDNNIIFATCNIQSVGLKKLQVSELLGDYSLDFLLLTETWLNDKHSRWKDCTVLNRDGLSLSMSDRTSRKGGGLALIYRSKYKTKLITK